MDAKKASGYYASSRPDAVVLKLPQGRALGD
jgi:hypothetical protein